MEEKAKCPSGIGGLDLTLDGGFPVGSVIVVSGSPLTGIDRMARQFWEATEDRGTYLMIDGELEPGMTGMNGAAPESQISGIEGARMVVDSLSSIILSNGIDCALRCLAAARQVVYAKKTNVLFTLYSDLHAPIEEIRVMRAADVFIELKEAIFMNEIERQLAVHKIKDMAVPRRLVPYLITEKGIELSTTSRVV